ncbi:MAG: response regulator [Gemmatimonadota bacterium]|nr:MAG: response regulator [Gemmatimonadota bacterium]
MSQSGRTKKILIVDDEPDVVSYLKMLLDDGGYETVTAADGSEGLEKVRQEKPDLVTLDITMPEASGTRFYKEMKTNAELSSIPIVIVTAVTGYGGDPYGYMKFLSHSRLVPEPEGFFPKPIDREALLEKVGELLS